MIGYQNLEGIHREAVGILQRVGLAVNGLSKDPRTAKALSDAGLLVEGDVVRFPSDVLDALLSRVPRKVSFHKVDGSKVELAKENTLIMTTGTSISVVDEVGGKARPSTSGDVKFAVQVQDSLENIDIVRSLVTSRDYGNWLDLADFFILFACVKSKMVLHRTIDPGQASLVLELAEISARDRGHRFEDGPPFTVLYCTKSPLSITMDTIQNIMIYGARGVPVFLLPMPFGGVSAPFSVHGMVMMAHSELLGSMALIQALRPGLPLIYGLAPMFMDMRAAYGSFGSPEVLGVKTLAIDIADQLGFVSFCSGGGNDAKELDAQMGYEKAQAYLRLIGRVHVLFGAGNMDSSDNFYIPCLFLDDELIGMAREVERLCREPEDPAELARLIEEVGIGGSFLGSEHTFRRCRSFWQPQLFTRVRYEMWDKESVTDRVAKRAKEFREESRELAVSEEALDAMREVFERATGLKPPL